MKNFKTIYFPAVVFILALLAASCGGKYDPYPGRPHAKVSPGRFSLSPDGKYIATDFRSLNHNGLYLFDSTGRALECIGTNDDTLRFFHPVFSEDGTKLAFVAGRAHNPFRIYLVSLKHRTIRSITGSNYLDSYPVFSPDGQTIYFIRHEGICGGDYPCLHGGDIHAFDVQSNLEYKISSLEAGNLSSLHIFPDGHRLMFGTDLLTNLGHMLFTLNLNIPNHLEPVVINFSRYAREPREIVYGYIPDRKDPSIKHRIVTNAYYEIRDFALSRDGKTLAFSWSNPEEPLGRQNEGYQLYVTDLATRKPRKLTSLPDGAYARSISPDGKVIYFTTLVGQNDFGQTYFPESTLWRINADGTGLAPVRLDFSGVVGKQPWITDNQALLAMKAVSQP